MTSRPDFYAHDHPRRLAAVRQAFGAADVDALLVTSASNLRYLTGFDGTLGALLLTRTAAVLVVDGRYAAAAHALAERSGLAELEVLRAERSLEEAMTDAVVRAGSVRSLGVEAAHMTLRSYDRLSEGLGRAEADPVRLGAWTAPRLRGTERLVEAARMIKEPVEIDLLREAARRLSGVARAVLPLVQPGRTEREVAAAIDQAIREAGFSRPAFDTIVASGPNSALPHARPGDRRLQPSDGVVLDFGGVYDGYCVDLTRTVQLAPLTEAYGGLYEAVRAAHAAAVAAIRPGVKASAVDAAARQVLERQGLAGAFLHGTGHGLGLDVHEEPRLSPAGLAQFDETLAAGMVFTVEPGAYVAGLGGVRLEDDVLVTGQGCEVLTDVPIDRRERGDPDPAGDR